MEGSHLRGPLALAILLLVSFSAMPITKGDDPPPFIAQTCSQTTETEFCVEVLTSAGDAQARQLTTVPQIQSFTLSLGVDKAKDLAKDFHFGIRVAEDFQRRIDLEACKSHYEASKRAYRMAIADYQKKKYDGVRMSLLQAHSNAYQCDNLIAPNAQQTGRNPPYHRECKYQMSLALLNLDILKLPGHPKKRN